MHFFPFRRARRIEVYDKCATCLFENNASPRGPGPVVFAFLTYWLFSKIGAYRGLDVLVMVYLL